MGKAFLWIMEKIARARLLIGGAACAVVAALEILAYCGIPAASFLASRVWMFGAEFTLAVILWGFASVCVRDIAGRRFWLPAGIVLLLAGLSLLIGNLEFGEVNPDAAQQLAAGLKALRAADYDYTAKAFLGYPARQYVLGALPAFFAGRSIVTLQMGFALPFLLGLMSFYTGLRARAEAAGAGSAPALFASFGIFAFPFIAEYYLNFEQAIYPVALTLAAAGFLLRYFSDGGIAPLAALTWTGCMMSGSYTPALASLALLVAFLLAALVLLASGRDPILRPRAGRGETAAWIGMSAALSAVFFIATLIGGRKDRLLELSGSSAPAAEALSGIWVFLSDRYAAFLGMTGLLVLAYLAAGITFRLKPRDFLVSLWTLGVFAAAFLLKGYTNDQTQWIMQRAMTVVPVLAAAAALTVFDRTAAPAEVRSEGPGHGSPAEKAEESAEADAAETAAGGRKAGMAAVLLAALCIAGFTNFLHENRSFTYFNYIQPMKYILSDLERVTEENGIGREDKFYLILFTDNILMKNPGDYMDFLFPNAVCVVPQGGEYPQGLAPGYPVVTYISGSSVTPPDSAVAEHFLVVNRRRGITVGFFRSVSVPADSEG